MSLAEPTGASPFVLRLKAGDREIAIVHRNPAKVALLDQTDREALTIDRTKQAIRIIADALDHPEVRAAFAASGMRLHSFT